MKTHIEPIRQDSLGLRSTTIPAKIPISELPIVKEKDSLLEAETGMWHLLSS